MASTTAAAAASPGPGGAMKSAPKANSPAAPATTSEALVKAIGARIKLTTDSQTLEGTLFSACPTLNLVAINTRPSSSSAAASDSGDYHIIPMSRVQNFQITAPLAPSPLAPVDTKRLKDREAARIAALKDEVAHRGKGVSREAQAIYDALKRVNIPIRWHNTEMIVHEAVIISPPYRPEDCKGSAQKVQVLNQVKRVLEGERRKLREREEKGGAAVRKGG
ncbi:hypothetical protein Q7P37_004985 [Cladosporium fusiforme]